MLDKSKFKPEGDAGHSDGNEDGEVVGGDDGEDDEVVPVRTAQVRGRGHIMAEPVGSKRPRPDGGGGGGGDYRRAGGNVGGHRGHPRR